MGEIGKCVTLHSFSHSNDIFVSIRAIERRLVDPYRRDAQKRAAFLQEVAEKQARLGVAVEATNKPKPKVGHVQNLFTDAFPCVS